MILFFGPPGSGKSVQGKLLVERNGWEWLSTGELFRNSNDPEVLKCLASGELIGDDLTNKVLDEALSNVLSEVVVLDGYPRNIDQAKWLDENMPKHDRKIRCIVLFDVPHDELVRRLCGRGREEDTVEVIDRRLEIYRQTTKPVTDYYRDLDIPMLSIDGVGDVNEIHERIQAAVLPCL